MLHCPSFSHHRVGPIPHPTHHPHAPCHGRCPVAADAHRVAAVCAGVNDSVARPACSRCLQQARHGSTADGSGKRWRPSTVNKQRVCTAPFAGAVCGAPVPRVAVTAHRVAPRTQVLDAGRVVQPRSGSQEEPLHCNSLAGDDGSRGARWCVTRNTRRQWGGHSGANSSRR
jgi:hypothetical protein